MSTNLNLKILITNVSVMMVCFGLLSLNARVNKLQGLLKELEDTHVQLIEECEKSLPRDKTCKLVAVEESE
mgnify:CR=1 FL=1